jgi:ATP-dependent DNA helicase RecG
MATIEKISEPQANHVIALQEGQFSDAKSIEITPAKLTRAISAFANSDGGELYIGIAELDDAAKTHFWRGFQNPEAANAHINTCEQFFPLGMDYQYEFLQCDSFPGLVLHVTVNKTQGIVKASNGIPYIRRGAQCLPVEGNEALRRLEYSKGVASFEAHVTDAPASILTSSPVLEGFLTDIVPTAHPEPWLHKQRLLRDARPTVAGVLLFAEEPQAILPKHCGIKVYRYRTREAEGFREAMEFTPITVEGCLCNQIKEAVRLTTEITERSLKLGETSFQKCKYPNETLHEIITNAVIHRDYSIADDVHIRIFDNRIEVKSPGRLPAHITAKNILNERFARNGAVVRLLNKFPNAPNKDVGEGLKTAFAAMHNFGLKEPGIIEEDNAVVVIIKHEPLASPEEAIMNYLETHDEITKQESRRVTHLRDAQLKSVFPRMMKRGLIERVPETRTSGAVYRKPNPQNSPCAPSAPAINTPPPLPPMVEMAEAIMKYLEAHETIKNSEARAVTKAKERRVRNTLNPLVRRGLIEKVPDTRTSGTEYRKRKPQITTSR